MFALSNSPSRAGTSSPAAALLRGVVAIECQASIGADAVLSALAGAAFGAGVEGAHGAALALASPFISPGCSFALTLAIGEARAAREARAGIGKGE